MNLLNINLGNKKGYYKKLKENGQDIVPITHEQAVLDSNGVTLD